MPNLGEGDKSWQRVKDLVEALLDYKLNNRNDITHLDAKWEDETTTHLYVTTTLEALRHLLKDKNALNAFKPNKTTSDKQVRMYIGEVLNNYLDENLKILKNHIPKSKRRGNSNRIFTLNLWSQKDKAKNLEELAKVWGGTPDNSRQNSEGKTEKDDVPADCPPDKSIRVAVSQMPESVPVWKGRDELVAKFTAKLVQILPDGSSPPKVLAIVGQGGMGKTSLAIKLVEGLGMNWQHSVSQAGKSFLAGGYECVMYFKVKKKISFDEVAGFLLSEGLGIPGAAELKKPEEKIAKIMMGLQQTRCLLVLDNLEDILHPAVEGENPDGFDSSQVHRTISPDWGKLLNALVYQQHQSQTILTSREVPADLAHTRYPGLAPDSELVHIEVLQGVDFAAGVEILQQRKLTDTLADLQWISQRVEGHVFLLTQLAALGNGKRGYLRKHSELVTKNAEPMLREQLARQSAAARDLLRRMCILRVRIDVRGLTFLRLYKDVEKDIRFELAAILAEPAEFTDAEISETAAILERLVGASLVQSRYDEENCEDFYDLHRVIEEFFKGQYKKELPILQEKVYNLYCTGKSVKNPQTLKDLEAVLEAQHFAFLLGNYREAYYLIPGEYLTMWGYWNLSKELYEQILPYVEGDLRSYCLTVIGAIYRDFGNWDLGEKYFKDALSIAKEDNKSHIGNSLGMLGDIERNRGNWDEAERLYRQSLALRTELGDRKGIVSCWGLLGNIEQCRGNWDEAERLYRQCLAIETELGDREGIATSIGCLGENELGKGNLDTAEQLLTEALGQMQTLGMTWHIAEVNYCFARLHRKCGNTEVAQQHYDTAHQIFQQLGAAKDVEKIEKEWHNSN